MKAFCTLGVACAGLLLAAAAPMRADFVTTTTLTPGADGATSPGSGTATISWMAATDTIGYTLSWSNLTGPAIMAHIHFGPPGVVGPILLPFFEPPMPPMPATDSISGTFTQA